MPQWASLTIRAVGCWVIAIGGKIAIWISGRPDIHVGVSLSGFCDLMGIAAIIFTAAWLIKWIIRRCAS